MASSYLHELFQMREVNVNNTISNLRSVANKSYVLPQAKCNWFKDSLSFSGVLVPLDIKNSSSSQRFIKLCSEWIRLSYDEVNPPPFPLSMQYLLLYLYTIAFVAHVYLFSYSCFHFPFMIFIILTTFVTVLIYVNLLKRALRKIGLTNWVTLSN